ncbi:hypothetical protein Q1695_011015 [Nippostrongylus brasiliensis]|nr:hypothetical protein Q1695_011015 [Nippostrongylus brasiliensis]
MMPSDNLEMNCEAIRWRVLPRVRQPALNYGIAFARIVHTDYEFLEEQLQVNYSPENTYCYHIDSKSLTSFKNQIIKLSSCLPNVFTTDVEITVDGRTGRNMNYAHLACLRLLEDKGRWKYVVLQQTHDVVIRTNEELKRIFQALNGSNDVQITPSPPSLYNHHTKWDADTLRVFEDVADGPPTDTRNVSLFVTKGAVQTSLSREAVEWINHVNLDKLVDQFNSGVECVDEMLISTLQAAENWAMPGHFTSECARREVPYNGITRMVKWSFDESECRSGFLRHNVCVLGVEDLASISKLDNILVNKIMPSFDYGAIACMSELLFNRTYLAQNDAPLNMTYFENLPAVRYHNDLNKTSFQLQCNYDWRTI